MKFTSIIAVLDVVIVYIANMFHIYIYIVDPSRRESTLLTYLFIYGLFNQYFSILDFIWSKLTNN
jgi:hypothetical protein